MLDDILFCEIGQNYWHFKNHLIVKFGVYCSTNWYLVVSQPADDFGLFCCSFGSLDDDFTVRRSNKRVGNPAADGEEETKFTIGL